MATRGEMINGLARVFQMRPNSVDVIDRSLVEQGYRKQARRGMAKYQMSPYDVSLATLAVSMGLGTKGRIRAIDCLIAARHVCEPHINFPMAFASVLEHISQGKQISPYISFSQLESSGRLGIFVDGGKQVHEFYGDPTPRPSLAQTRITLFAEIVRDISGLVTPSYCRELSDIYERLTQTRGVEHVCVSGPASKDETGPKEP